VVYIPDSTDTSVFILGAVNHQGVFSLTPQMSFMDALSQDGNFSDVRLVRPSAGVDMKIDMTDILAPQKNLNVAINEGDIIFVTGHGTSQFGYIMQQINPLKH
jgi:polysaccharide export outer membrane protein